MSEGFVVEGLKDGVLTPFANVETHQSLLNDSDLNIIRYCVGAEGMDVEGFRITITDEMETDDIFVRKAYNPSDGYFIDRKKRWAYGSREQAINDIKARL